MCFESLKTEGELPCEEEKRKYSRVGSFGSGSEVRVAWSESTGWLNAGSCHFSPGQGSLTSLATHSRPIPPDNLSKAQI